MPAWRCGVCNLNYPTTANEQFKSRCPLCEGRTSYYTNIGPDTNWEDRVRERLRELKGELALSVEPSRGGSPHSDDDSCQVIYRNDTDTVHVLDQNLRRLGYLPESWDVVKLNGKYYELVHMDLRGRIWWLNPMDVEQEIEQNLGDLPVTDFESPADTFLFIDFDEQSEGEG